MLRSMYTAITGLRNHQTMLDTVANNIANVNTYGFKGQNTSFRELLSQTISGASAPTATMGGINAKQVGLGMTIGSVTQRMTQGAIQTTGVATDLAINGDGFFRVTNDPSNLATNTQPTFYQRDGQLAFDMAGDLVTQDGFYVIGYDELAPPGSGVPDDTVQKKINVPPATAKDISISADGRVTYTDTSTGSLMTAGWISMAKFANPQGLAKAGANKWQSTTNSGIEITDIGTGSIHASGMGSVLAGSLEMSNVDLATEFTEMIKAQRGFQASSRVITTSDEVLQELVNLKR